MLVSPRLQIYFDDYASCHTTKGNQWTHSVGIPLIVISLLGLLSRAVLWKFSWAYIQLDAAILLLVPVCSWYLWLSWRIAFAFSLVLIGFYFTGRAFSVPVNLFLFVFGWILQGIGHGVYEKNSPAFFRSLVHLAIGPLWIFYKILKPHS